MTEQHAGSASPTTLRTQLVDVMNHELRTPLAAIVGHCELLGELELPESAHRSVQAIVQAGERLARLAGKVTMAAELEAATSQVVRAPADVVALVHEVAAGFASRLAAAGVRLEVRSSRGSVTGFLDREKVRRALVGLIRNAVNHAPPGSLVEVEVEHRPHCLVLAVTDEGPGLDPDRRAQLARPVDLETLDRLPGPGVGLPLACTVAELHGGRLELFGNTPTGLRVRMELPQRYAPRSERMR